MSRRTALTFAVVATILYLWGLQQIVEADPQFLFTFPTLLLAAIIPAVGILVAIPLWIAALRGSVRYRQRWWLIFLLVSVPAMPLAVLIYYIAVDDEQLHRLPAPYWDN